MGCRVNSVLYRSQGVGASVYPATVKPPLDTLGGKASRVPPGYTVHLLALPTLLLMDSRDHLLLLSCSLSLILPCISLWLTGWHWLLHIQIWINASLLVCPHFWCLACLRPFVVPSARHCTCVVVCLQLANILSILSGCALLCLLQYPAVQANPLVVLGLGLVEWLACNFAAAYFIRCSPCYLEFAEFWCSCEGPWWYVALPFGAALWCGSCFSALPWF